MGMIVNGTFVLMCVCVFGIHFFEKMHTTDIPYGIWNNFIMVFYCIITGLFIASDKNELLHSVRQYFIYSIIMYSICLVSKHKKSFQWFLQTIIISVLICCVHLLIWGYHFTANRIVLSANSNPNLLGTILNLGLFALLYRMKSEIKSFFFSLPIMFLIIYNVIMTGSRKSFIVSSIILVIWAYATYVQMMRNGSIREKVFIALALILIALVTWYYYTSFVVHTAVFDRMQTMGEEESNSIRIEMYKEAYGILMDKPIFGGGLDQYRFWSGRGGYSHSTYAEAIADFGIVGSLLFFIPYVYSIYQAMILTKRKKRVYQNRLILGLCIIEVFLGIGQIWFIEISHFFAWTIVFLGLMDLDEAVSNNTMTYERRNKYVRY